VTGAVKDTKQEADGISSETNEDTVTLIACSWRPEKERPVMDKSSTVSQ
jgi:hypothetical protein